VPGITVERGEAIGEGLKTAVGGKESDNLGVPQVPPTLKRSHECCLSHGKLEIVVVILGHFSDNGG
jgi:hypothetical protein